MDKTVRIGCAVPEIRIADPACNAEKICAMMAAAGEQGCDLLLFPELALTGYTCGDLFFQNTLLEGAQRGLQKILEASRGVPQLTAVVGLPVQEGGTLYNSAAVLQNGRLLAVVPKPQLPAYRDSMERRWFSPGEKTGCVTLPQGLRLSVWQADGEPGDILLEPAAAPELTGGHDCRRQRVMEQSREHGAVHVFCSAGCSESTQDFVYSGHCIIARNGQLLAETEALATTNCLLTADTDAAPRPVQDRRDPWLDTFRIQTAGLAQRLKTLGAKAVIGVSGGLDSTLALLVAVAAMERLNRPSTDVHALTLPGFGTSDRTYTNALQLMRLLGVTTREIPIREAVRQHFLDIGHDACNRNTTYENAQARERTQILMDYAGTVGGIAVGTGDLSELALGFCTYNGDHMSMYSVNSSIPKTMIPRILLAAAQLPGFASAGEILQDIVATPISPELLPPDAAGNISQQTETLVGPYLLHDFFLTQLLCHRCGPRQIWHRACREFAGSYDDQTVKKWLKVFLQRFFAQQFKRSCMPEGVQATPMTLSPRHGWCMPSDAAAQLWLQELEEI